MLTKKHFWVNFSFNSSGYATPRIHFSAFYFYSLLRFISFFTNYGEWITEWAFWAQVFYWCCLMCFVYVRWFVRAGLKALWCYILLFLFFGDIFSGWTVPAKTHILIEHIGCTCYANDQTYSYAGDIYHAETSERLTEIECRMGMYNPYCRRPREGWITRELRGIRAQQG